MIGYRTMGRECLHAGWTRVRAFFSTKEVGEGTARPVHCDGHRRSTWRRLDPRAHKQVRPVSEAVLPPIG